MLKKFALHFSVLGLLLAECLFATAANDTLTIRQVYNFSVGDTFDYYVQWLNADEGFGDAYYVRKILTQKTYSSSLDSIYFVYYLPRWGTYEMDSISQLDSFAIYQDTSGYINCPRQYSFDDLTFPGHPSDSLNIGCSSSNKTYRFTSGMGRTYFDTIIPGDNGYDSYSEDLIYFANDSVTVGSPYYVVGEANLIHYIPLPEECAVWTETFFGDCVTSNPVTYGTIIYQISTGSKIHYNNKTFVELLLRTQNSFTNTFTPDSLIGYFYNDSVAQAAFFVQDTNSTNIRTLAYFGSLNGDGCAFTGTISIDSILIGNSYRTEWNCAGLSEYCPCSVIAGIGSICGLLPNNTCITNYCGDLSCFSVCGQTLFPNDTTSCPLLTGIVQIPSPVKIELSPNPTYNYCTLQVSNSGENLSASIFDITGREIQSLFANQRVSTFNFSTASLAAGVYLVQLTDAAGGRNTIKLIKQ